ncbi:MAG: hypothetical protein FJX76_09505 [Armatimonadetes bacterium]|nr:hypothetical protein [Armatimonadota bacterium]
MSSASTGRGKAAAEQSAPATPTQIVPTENPAAYNDDRLWRLPPWGDTYWCEMCSTCMRWRYSQRIGGRVCVTSFNFNFPLVIIEGGRCNEYRPVPGAEGLWADDYGVEEEDYENGGGMRRREEPMEEDPRRAAPQRRRPRRRPRRGASGQGPSGI